MTVQAAILGAFPVDEFAKIFRDFGTKLPDITELIINQWRPMVGLLMSLVAVSVLVPLLLWLAPAASWLWPVVYRLPMVGPLLRWSHLAQFARLMGLLLEQAVPLPDALRVTAAGLGDAGLARGCRRAADDLEKGRPLDESLAARRQFPASLIPIIQWGQRAPALPDAFRAAAEMFEGRACSESTLLEAMLPLILLLVVVLLVGLFVIAMFMPFIALIQNLSGG
jgi:type II secretory pathway component PulF